MQGSINLDLNSSEFKFRFRLFMEFKVLKDNKCVAMDVKTKLVVN